MAEKIKGTIDACVAAPRCVPYVCDTARALKGTVQEIKELCSDDFLIVYNHSKDLDLPPDFKEELDIEYKIRGFP